MRTWGWVPLVVVVGSSACQTGENGARSMTPPQTAAIEDSVRRFAATVASDLTGEGPAAWRRHFAATSAFFMASEGQIVLPNSDSATAVIRDLARGMTHLELRWGDSLRVDPLVPGLAVLGAPYREVRVDTAGHRVEEAGYMTAVVEDRAGRWQFRSLHWSVVHAPPPVR